MSDPSEARNLAPGQALAICLAAIAATVAVMIAIQVFGKASEAPGTVEVSVMDILERVKDAESRADMAINAVSRSAGERQQLAKQIAQVAGNHNRFVPAVANDINATRGNIMVVERALQRLHGKPEWVAAKAGALAEIEQENEEANQPALEPDEEAEAEPEAVEETEAVDAEDDEG